MTESPLPPHLPTTCPAPPTPVQTLFLQHSAAVRGFVWGLVADRTVADDIFQEVFLTVARQQDEFDRTGNFLAWVRGIARNKVLEHWRRQRTGRLLFDEQLLELLAESAETAFDKEDERLERRREALARCLQRLAPRAREIIDLRYAEQPLAPPELARRIGWTTNAVNVALARARAFLRACTQQVLTGADPA